MPRFHSFLSSFFVMLALSTLWGCGNRKVILGLDQSILGLTLSGRVSGSGAFVEESLSLASGNKLDLKWTISGTADSCTLLNVSASPAVEVVSHPLLVSQATGLTIDEASLFELHCEKGNISSSVSFMVSVISVKLMGRVGATDAYAENNVSISSGNKLDLSWEITGNPTSCSLKNISASPSEEVVNDPKTLSQVFTNDLSTTTQFELRCVKGPETAAATLLATVPIAPLPTLSTILRGRQSGVGSYVENAVSVYTGQQVDLNWTITGSPPLCTLRSNLNPAADVAFPLTASSTTIGPFANPVGMILTLRCERAQEVQTDDLVVTVVNAPVPNANVTDGAPNAPTTAITGFDFGGVTVGQYVEREFVLNSIGNADLVAPALQGVAAPFSATYNCHSSNWAPMTSCRFKVRFTPTQVVQSEKVIQISYSKNGATASYSLTFRGLGVAAPAPHGLDGSFANQGGFLAGSRFHINGYGSMHNARGVLIQRVNGVDKLLVHGDGTPPSVPDNSFAIARLNMDGSVDTTFGNQGLVITPFSGMVGLNRVLVQPDGKILAGGNMYASGATRIVMARYSANGALDSSFGTGGRVETSISNIASGIDFGVNTDGSITALARIRYNATVAGKAQGAGGYIVRYSSAGAMQSSKYIELIRNGGLYNVPTRLVILSDGKLLVGGSGECTPHGVGTFALAVGRFSSDGTLDTTFGTSGITCTGLVFSDVGYKELELRNNEIVVVGEAANGAGAHVAYLNLSGGVIRSFSVPGAYPLQHSAVRADGRVVIAGFSDAAAKRMSLSGTVEKVYPLEGYNGWNNGSFVQPDNKVIVFGSPKGGGISQVKLSRFLP